jgi:hypothetical protein
MLLGDQVQNMLAQLTLQKFGGGKWGMLVVPLLSSSICFFSFMLFMCFFCCLKQKCILHQCINADTVLFE